MKCAQSTVDEKISQYILAMEEGMGDTRMPEPSKALPIKLFDSGFDVWIDGNRGATYQKGYDESKITPADYWDFTVVEMGTQD